VISGLIGLRPRSDNTVEVNPLVPPSWDYFCLDQIPYHGLNLTILFDKTGTHYGKGLRIFADGKAIAAAAKLARVTGPLPPPAPVETSGGWKKFAGNPVMGGTWCFTSVSRMSPRGGSACYNGRHGDLEQIGVVLHEGEDLGFDAPGALRNSLKSGDKVVVIADSIAQQKLCSLFIEDLPLGNTTQLSTGGDNCQ